MGTQDWRNRDPIEDQIYNRVNPDDHVNEMEEVNRKIQETKENLNDDSVDLIKCFMEIVVLSRDVRKKAEIVEEEFENQIED